MAIATINPATGETERVFDAHTAGDIDAALAQAEAAFAVTRRAAVSERTGWLRGAAEILRTEKNALAAILTTEMGKTLKSAVAEVEKCAWVCDFYAENAEAYLADRAIPTEAARSFVRYLPIGPVLAVMPWNFPLWQVFRFAAPAIAAGNVGVLKHASNVPQSALAMEDIWLRAGAPKGAFQTLLIGGGAVEGVLTDPRIRAATLTGSEGAGRAVGETAGRELKKVVLELGGADAFIVTPSADLDLAVEKAVQSRTLNNGQSCISAKRFIVHADVYDAFRDAFAAKLGALKVGDPMADDTEIGPLATEAIRAELAQQVEDSVAAGAARVVGAEMIDGPGWFYRPGLLDAIPESAPAYAEELFGPVASLFKAGSFDEAIAIANATPFGLSSAIFTNDEAEIERAFNELDAGGTFVNAFTASDPRLPFGGVKASGHGRELAAEGMREFLNVKTCVVAG
ncbi:MAG: NAD-dependent succinate-semialdehyde dehydrogenase [Pseudomonadota bacterium]